MRARSWVIGLLAVVVPAGCASAAPGSGPPLDIVIEDGRTAPEPAVRIHTPVPSATVTEPAQKIGRHPAAEDRFAWADNAFDAVTITLVHGLTPQQAVDVLAGHRAQQRFSSYRAALDWQYGSGSYDRTSFAARRIGGWTVVLEDNGFRAIDHRVLAALARKGAATAVYESVNADMYFLYAHGGQVVREFDPLLDDSVLGRPLPQERGIRFGAEDDLRPMAQSLLLMQRLIGVALTHADVSGQQWDVLVGTPL